MDKIYPVYTTIEKNPTTVCQNLSETVFEYPFFNEGVLLTKQKSTKKYTLKLAEDENEGEEETLELKGLIFHTSHCGSTLLCRMLNQIKSVRVVNEPESINGLLLSMKLYSIPDEEIKERLRRIVKSYQQKTDSKHHLIIKLTSWNVYFINLILQTFPKIKWIYLDRDNESLINSLMKKDGGFIDWWQHPVDELRKHFIDTNKDIKNKEQYLREIISGHRMHAMSKKENNNIFLEYPEFIKNYQVILDYFELKPTIKELKNLREAMKYDSKSTGKKLWKQV